jgi:hypothetical protein
MHAQVNKPDENKSTAGADSVAQKKMGADQTFQVIDNRPRALVQKQIQRMLDKSSQGKHLIQMQLGKRANNISSNNSAGPIQLAKVTVRNQTDNYTSGWVQSETQSTGVDDGPKAEAQKVAGIAGGTWYGGHMVNDRLGGTGGYSNIVPVTSSMNGKHKTIENASRNKVGNGLGSYEARYNMDILERKDFNFSNGDQIVNQPVEFKQSYDYRLKTGLGGITTVNGEKLNMFDSGSKTFK